MIVLDTHIWVWWVHGDTSLTNEQAAWLQEYEPDGLGVSAISYWEIAKLVEYDRIVLPYPVEEWMGMALFYPGIRFLNLTPQIANESTQLPAGLHKDPADQIIVATARIYNCPLLTADAQILDYEHVETLT
ncbi:MAG: type II toxin-antitoxin system VapC family toxin [Candidatus Poribacteria bacterium]|nr:type II toxin-antitoxin system VapC family toxin [Candidatus Poribacteria bacterium]